MRISDWSSDVCSSDLDALVVDLAAGAIDPDRLEVPGGHIGGAVLEGRLIAGIEPHQRLLLDRPGPEAGHASRRAHDGGRSEERRVGKECGSTCRSRWSPYH